MANGNGTQPPDYNAMIAQLVSQISGVLAIETPQLGRVEFHRPQDIYAALNLLRMEQARAAGQSTAGVITIGYDRGLRPVRSYYP